MNHETSSPLTTYRLDRRFVLQAIGLTLLAAGVALAVGMLISAWVVVLALWVLAAALLARAGALWFRPPPVALLDGDGMTLGGRLTVRPVAIVWTDVQDVSLRADRLVIDRGGDAVLVFPLRFVGRRGHELVREVYDRLNTAHGYRRFDPAQDGPS